MGSRQVGGVAGSPVASSTRGVDGLRALVVEGEAEEAEANHRTELAREAAEERVALAVRAERLATPEPAPRTAPRSMLPLPLEHGRS